MSATQQRCTSRNNNLDIIEFTIEGEVFKTCNICKERKKEKRNRKNRCTECGIKATFNYENQKDIGGIRCKSHIESGMIDVLHPRCIKCKVKRPTFNFEGETDAIHCKECSSIGMIDVTNTKCIVCKIKIPNFNFEGESKATGYSYGTPDSTPYLNPRGN